MINVGSYWRVALVIPPSVAGALPLAIFLVFVVSGTNAPIYVFGYDLSLNNSIVPMHLAIFAPVYVVWIAMFLVLTIRLAPRRMERSVWIVPAGFFLSAGSLLWASAKHENEPLMQNITFGGLLLGLITWTVAGYFLIFVGFGIRRGCKRIGFVGESPPVASLEPGRTALGRS